MCQTAGMVIEIVGFIGIFLLAIGMLLAWLRQDIARHDEQLAKLHREMVERDARIEGKIDRQGDRFDAEIAKLRQEMVKQGDRLEGKIDRLHRNVSAQIDRLEEQKTKLRRVA